MTSVVSAAGSVAATRSAPPPQPRLVLYEYEGSPWCRRVRVREHARVFACVCARARASRGAPQAVRATYPIALHSTPLENTPYAYLLYQHPPPALS